MGWKTWWNYRVPRRQTVRRLQEAVATFARRRVRRAFAGRAQRIELTNRYGIEANSVVLFRQSLASYAGHLQHGAAWGAWGDVWQEYPWLAALFRRTRWRFTLRWSSRGARRLRDRYVQLVRSAGDDCLVFFRLGRYIEFYGPQRLLAEQILGLQRVHLPRAGYAFTAGFPVWLAARCAERALARACAVLTIQRGDRMAVLWPLQPSDPAG